MFIIDRFRYVAKSTAVSLYIHLIYLLMSANGSLCDGCLRDEMNVSVGRWMLQAIGQGTVEQAARFMANNPVSDVTPPSEGIATACASKR
jgi:hypothetical protein